MSDGDLVAFLTARLDEDEEVAKIAAGVAGPDWTWKTEVPEGRGEPTDYVTSMTGALLLDTMGGIESEAPFIARHDPARALREVTAKRAILAEHRPTEWTAYGEHMCFRCILDDDEPRPGDHHWLPYPCPTVRALAAVYFDHPDCRPEWKP